MEYFQILNDFLYNNKIDANIVPYIIELFELNREVVFLGEENRNIDSIYKLDNLDSMVSNRNVFLDLENKKIEMFISELRSLKTVTDEESYTLLDGLISDKEKFREKIVIESSDNKNDNLEDYKNSLVYRFENNRKKILLRYSKINDIKTMFEKLNKRELYADLTSALNSIKIKSRFNTEDSFLILLSKIEEEKSKLDTTYLKSLGLDGEVEDINNYREQIFNKEDAINYLNKIFDLSIKHSKPLSNNENMLKIALLEQRLYSKNIYSYFEKIKEHPQLQPYSIVLQTLLEELYKDVLSEEDHINYLKTLDSALDTMDSLNSKIIPLKVYRGAFDYDASYDSVKTVVSEKDKRIVRYTKGETNTYSVIENRDILSRDLDYWKKEIDYGFDRYDKGDFYEEVIETLNLAKFYYRLKNYVVCSEVSNKLFNIESSIDMTKKDKEELDKIYKFIQEKMNSIRIIGIDQWKEENNPEVFFSNKENISDLDRQLLFNSIIPKDGVGRDISTFEMVNAIYGKEYIKTNLTVLEEKRVK